MVPSAASKRQYVGFHIVAADIDQAASGPNQDRRHQQHLADRPGGRILAFVKGLAFVPFGTVARLRRRCRIVTCHRP